MYELREDVKKYFKQPMTTAARAHKDTDTPKSTPLKLMDISMWTLSILGAVKQHTAYTFSPKLEWGVHMTETIM